MLTAMSDMATIDPAVRAKALVAARFGLRARLLLRVTILLIIGCLVIPVGTVAIGSGTGLIALPYEMFELAGRAPILFPAHMLSSALALLIAPVVIAVRHRPDVHRALGRLLGAFVVIGG